MADRHPNSDECASARYILSVLSIPLFLFLLLFAFFALGTGAGSEEDVKEAMLISGAAFAVIGLILLNWTTYGLRGGWRIFFSIPCVCVILFGLLGVLNGVSS